MNILVTAIGSMSASCVISALKKNKHIIVGCDIYPTEWHAESKLCDKVYQVSLASNEEEYIYALLKISIKNSINYLVPLTDLEIDVLDKYRNLFSENEIQLCMPSSYILQIVRNKHKLYQKFCADPEVPSIMTFLCKEGEIPPMQFPYIAKPYNGRSSEGLLQIETKEEFEAIKNKSIYILQEYKVGNVYTVDYIRCQASGKTFSIAREELLRTKNGAGLTVKAINSQSLSQLVSHIGQKLEINGCVNMEFIKNNGRFFLIDINPRFSAGVAFSQMLGYDMVNNHINCYTGNDITPPIEIKEHILTKKYQEEVLL